VGLHVYHRSLFYPPSEGVFRGKTSDRGYMLNVRFVELAPRRRIVEAVSFVTTDACLDQIAGAFLGGDRQVAGPFLSVSIRLIRVGPAMCGVHGSPIRVLSRCM
jgi:hypothetical protein